MAFSILFVSGCSSENETSYKYADKWEPSNQETGGYEPTEEFYSLSTSVNNKDVMAVKNAVQECFKELNFDWENYEEVDKVNYVSPRSEEDLRKMSPEMAIMIYSYYAMYSDETKEIYLFPSFFDGGIDNNMQAHVVAHELIHALISTGHKNYSQLEEGVVDHYATVFMNSKGLNTEPTYFIENGVVEWLITVFGEDEIISATREGRLHQLIDGSTKPGMGEKLDAALSEIYNCQNLEEVSERLNVVYDILAHVANHVEDNEKRSTLQRLLQEANYVFKGIDENHITEVIS